MNGLTLSRNEQPRSLGAENWLSDGKAKLQCPSARNPSPNTRCYSPRRLPLYGRRAKASVAMTSYRTHLVCRICPLARPARYGVNICGGQVEFRRRHRPSLRHFSFVQIRRARLKTPTMKHILDRPSPGLLREQHPRFAAALRCLLRTEVWYESVGTILGGLATRVASEVRTVYKRGNWRGKWLLASND